MNPAEKLEALIRQYGEPAVLTEVTNELYERGMLGEVLDRIVPPLEANTGESVSTDYVNLVNQATGDWR